MSACHRKETCKKSKRCAWCLPVSPTSATSGNKRGNSDIHARLVACCFATKHPIHTHALIGRQRRTSGMEENHDTATHTQTLREPAAAAT